MKYNKQTLSKLTPEEIQDISYSKLMKGTIWSSVNMLVCAFQWLLKAYKLRYIFIAVSAILIPYLVVLIVRLIRLDKAYEASLKASAERRKKAISELEIERERKKNEEGGAR